MEQKTISFTSDSQLLAELGERLIATPQIALGELVKNAYDADATKVNIWLSDDRKHLFVKDDGHGMSETDFCNAWMRIASSHKLDEECSPRYGRPLTGSKGVGRFAVRLLGDELLLETASADERLRAKFPWHKFESGSRIDSKPITYWTDVDNLWTGIESAEDVSIEVGTLLRVSSLRQSWNDDKLKEVSGFVLGLQTPYFSKLADAKKSRHSDPGFKIYISPPGVEQNFDDPTIEILERAEISLRLKVIKKKVTFVYSFSSGKDDIERGYTLPDENLIGSVDADIRFLPKRPGLFARLRNYDGREAAAWVRANSGIRVYERGFRILPYGTPNDDWIRLARDVAARRRTWDSGITDTILPKMSKTPTEAEHPALHLPGNHQVIGYVSITTHNLSKIDEDLQPMYLQPAMDRQGFVNNDGFQQLYSIVRAGMEVMAALDLEEQMRRKREARKKAASDLQEQIDEAIVEVKNNTEIPPEIRKSIGRQLLKVQAQAKRTEAAREEAEISVETLGLLGVVAAFMTHEMTTMVREVGTMRTAIERIDLDVLPPSQRERFVVARSSSNAAFEALERHIEFTRRFASNVRSPPSARYKARVAINGVVDQFKYFTTPRNILVDIEVAPALLAPSVPISVYGGLVMNLYTNALKAVLSKKDGTTRQIQIQAVNDEDTHIVRVSDTGIGIVSSLHSRIFDPLFSTSEDDGPLGPGMGMGLYIVRRVMRSLRGQARLAPAAEGFSTTLELRFPNE
jgi:signal transduction histidine kinase